MRLFVLSLVCACTWGFLHTGLLHWNLGGLWPFPRFPSRFHCSGIVEDHLAKTKKDLLAFPTSSLLSSPPAWCLSLPCLSHTCYSSQPACPQMPCTLLGPLLLWPSWALEDELWWGVTSLHMSCLCPLYVSPGSLMFRDSVVCKGTLKNYEVNLTGHWDWWQNT